MEKPLAQRGERKLPPQPKVAPWLVFSHGDDGKFHTFVDMSDHMNKYSSRKFIPELIKNCFWQKPSHQGWLVINSSDSGDCFLWNPESLETIMLPKTEPFIESQHFIRDCVLSSPPRRTNSISSSSSSSSSDDDSDDYYVGNESMVYFLVGGGSCNFLIYCCPGDKEWKKQVLVDKSVKPRSMFYVKGKLFIVGLSNVLVEVAMQQHGCSDSRGEEETLKIIKGVAINEKFSPPAAGILGHVCYSTFIESFGEVFRIRRFYIPRGAYIFLTEVEITKLNFSSMAWEEVKSLGDHVFFLSGDSELSCLASELGLPKGCVFFTQTGETSLYKYDLEDNSVLHSIPCPDLPTPWSSSQWLMITPTTPMVEAIRRIGNHVLQEEIIKANITRTSTNEDADKEDAGEPRPSLIVNEDMVRLISDRLHKVDYLHLRAVGKIYRSILNLRSFSTGTVQTIGLSPWLVSVKYDECVYNFVSPMHNDENYLMSIPELLKGSTIRFSKDGWLLMSTDKTLFFHNPFSKSIVRVPDLPNSYHFSGISFSSLPTSSDCVVFCIDQFPPNGVTIAFIKRGDEAWSKYYYDNVYLPPIKNNAKLELSFNNPVFHRGAFYCLDLNGSLGVFKLEDDTSWEILAMVPRPNCEFIYKSFLVECEGDLLCVLLGRLGKWVRVFRLDNKEMVWGEVKNLGRHMLFISHTSSTAAVAPTKHMENKIYLSRLHEDGILFYSLDTGLFHSLGGKHSAKDYGNSKENLICSWIEPNCSETTSEPYLDW